MPGGSTRKPADAIACIGYRSPGHCVSQGSKYAHMGCTLFRPSRSRFSASAERCLCRNWHIGISLTNYCCGSFVWLFQSRLCITACIMYIYMYGMQEYLGAHSFGPLTLLFTLISACPVYRHLISELLPRIHPVHHTTWSTYHDDVLHPTAGSNRSLHWTLEANSGQK
jgi:hypothetical protein